MRIYSSNAIAWVWASNGGPWKFHFILNEFKAFSSPIQVESSHVLHSSNAMACALVKQGVDRLSPFVAFHLEFFFR